MENSEMPRPVGYPNIATSSPKRSADRSRPLLRIPRHRIENDLDRHFIAHGGIDHQVETMPSRASRR